MTLLRKLADGISRGIVRLAKPGAKEWAQATAREMELIESDWSALVWALGSLRIVFKKQETPITSPAQVPQVASRFTRAMRKKTVMGCAGCGYLAINFFWFGWHPIFGRHTHHHLMGRIAAYLTAAAMAYMIGQFLALRGRLPSIGDSPATAGEYRIALERQRDFHRGTWLWSRVMLMTPGYLLFCVSIPTANAAGVMLKLSIILTFLILCVIAVPLNLRMAGKYQRRINELDALEKAA